MRIQNNISRDLEKQQLFFLECWASMSNVRSLDSDRVSYNNILNSVLELLDLYSLGTKHRAAEKRLHVVEELNQLMDTNELLLRPEFKGIPQQLKSIFKEHGKPLEEKKELIISFLEELKELLEEHYRRVSIEELTCLLQDGADHSESSLVKIYNQTNALISHLITLGMPTSECYLLCRNFLIKRRPHIAFLDAFNSLANNVTITAQKYSVKLSLDNKALYELLTQTSVVTLGECQFTVQEREENDRSYIINSTIHVHSISFSAARDIAEKKLMQAIDLFSYFLGKNQISILVKADITDENGQTKNLPRFDKDLENSLDRWIDDDLSVYMDAVTHLRKKGSQKTSNKISAAFRFFQNGVNEKGLESRFTAFWSALESLTLIEENSNLKHDEHVINAVLPCIAMDYPLKQLFAFRGCAKALEWEPINLNGSPFTIQSSNLGEIYTALKNADFVEEVNRRLETYPYAQFRFSKFIGLCSSPFELAQKIEAHQRKVELHINRLYRIRNAIVHNATSHERLELLVVNLEHYLRSTLNALFYTVEKSSSITSSEEAFIRYQYEANKIFEEMDPSLKEPERNREGKQRSIRGGTVRVSDIMLINWLSMHG